MTQTRAPTKAGAAVAQSAQPPDRPQAGSPKAGHQRHLSPCWRHFLEMLAAMAVGMIATGPVG